MIKKNLISISLYSCLLLFFIYVDIKNDFPIEYMVVLVVAYVSVIFYKILEMKKYKGES